MLKLMKLEIKKYKVRGFVKRALIANIIILGLTILMSYLSKNDNEDHLTNFNALFSPLDLIIEITFIIFAAVLISKFIIDEYKNKTITILFIYPVPRKKLIISKILTVIILTFSAIFLSDIFISSVLCILNSISGFVPEKLTSTIMLKRFITICLISFTSSGIGLLPLYFAVRKKSSKATKISSIIIATVVCGNLSNGRENFSLSSITAIPITLAIIGFISAYFVIRNIEDVDVI